MKVTTVDSFGDTILQHFTECGERKDREFFAIQQGERAINQGSEDVIRQQFEHLRNVHIGIVDGTPEWYARQSRELVHHLANKKLMDEKDVIIIASHIVASLVNEEQAARDIVGNIWKQLRTEGE
jgi:RNase P protein component